MNRIFQFLWSVASVAFFVAYFVTETDKYLHYGFLTMGLSLLHEILADLKA